jgi:hypothetical protein
MKHFFLGSDTSKDKINFCLYFDGLMHSDSECKNDQKSIETEIKMYLDYCNLYAERENTPFEFYVSCEYTGIYNNILL